VDQFNRIDSSDSAAISRAEIARLALFCVATLVLVVAANLGLVALADSLQWTCRTECSAAD
jgi:hypothetical protein